MAEDENTLTPKRLYLAVLIAVLGGNTGSIINGITPAVRSDPMTGTQGKALQSEQLRLRDDTHRIDKIQAQMLIRMSQRENQEEAIFNLIKQHMKNHP